MATTHRNPVARTLHGIAAAIRARPLAFAAMALGVFLLDLILPPLVLSLTRKPFDYLAVNPWLKKLPGYLVSSSVPLSRKIEFLPGLALFWISADGPYGAPEWGFAVDVTDLARFALMSLLIATYFVLWLHRRERAARAGWGARAGRHGGLAGALVSVLGFSTGPCSVVGCGAPVIPVVGLAFAGLSSGTLKLMAGVSTVATLAVLVAMTLGVLYFAWLAGSDPDPT